MRAELRESVAVNRCGVIALSDEVATKIDARDDQLKTL